MMSTRRFCFAVQLVLCQVFHEISAQQCDGEYSIHGMMLKQHVYKTMKTSISFDCLQVCNDDVKCQSFNYVIFKSECELNNRTKEARPEDYVPDSDRFYYGRVRKRGKMPLVSDIVKKKKGIEVKPKLTSCELQLLSFGRLFYHLFGVELWLQVSKRWEVTRVFDRITKNNNNNNWQKQKEMQPVWLRQGYNCFRRRFLN